MSDFTEYFTVSFISWPVFTRFYDLWVVGKGFTGATNPLVQTGLN